MLAASYARSLDNEVLNERFAESNIQFGTGVAGGTEKAIHLARTFLQSLAEAGVDVIALSLDGKNAFNALVRAIMLAELYEIERAINCWRIYDWVYGSPNLIVLVDHGKPIHVVPVHEGVIQGDPLASHGFCVGTLRVLERCLEGLQNVRVICDVDDTLIVGSVPSVIEVFRRLSVSLPTIGIVPQPVKSACLWPFEREAPEELAHFLTSESIPLRTDFLPFLGSCLGLDSESQAQFLLSKVQKMSDFFDLLRSPLLPAPVSFRLLLFCGATRATFLARTTPLSLVEHADIFPLFDV